MPISVYTNLSGRPLTKGLFFETNGSEDKTGVLYTLKDKDHEYEGNLYKSLYLLYMEESDLTEFQFANKFLDGWSHWQMIVNATWFKEYIDRWRWELELKVKAEALKRLQNEAKESSRNAYNANRFLVEGGWIPRGQAKDPVGRPTQERIKREAERINQLERDILDDHSRIN